MVREKYVNLLKGKLELHMSIHNSHIFMNDSAPYDPNKAIKKFLEEKKIEILEWPGNSPDLICKNQKKKSEQKFVESYEE